jgi:hypothetical protein
LISRFSTIRQPGRPGVEAIARPSVEFHDRSRWLQSPARLSATRAPRRRLGKHTDSDLTARLAVDDEGNAFRRCRPCWPDSPDGAGSHAGPVEIDLASRTLTIQ